MAWTTPTTPVTGTAISTTAFGIPVTNDLALLSGASTGNYAAGSALWSGTVTNPVLGNGTLSARYRQDSKWVDVFVQITMGSTTTYGSGTWIIALPVAARDTNWGGAYGRAFDVSVSTSVGYRISADATTTTIGLRCDATTAGNVDRIVTSTTPFTWATGDILTLNFRYEAA